jgi:Yip1-like protein
MAHWTPALSGDTIPPRSFLEPALQKEIVMTLLDRVKRILLSPRTEWEVIDGEQTTPAALYRGYIAPLAAIGPVAQFIGDMVFGIPAPFVGTIRPPVGPALSSALILYVLILAGTYLLAIVIDALAPTFNSQRNQIQALKLAAYSSTAGWVAGILGLIPWIRPLQLVGLYSLYLLYLGLPIVMKTPREKVPVYTAGIVLAGVVLFVIAGAIAGRFSGIPHAGMTVP